MSTQELPEAPTGARVRFAKAVVGRNANEFRQLLAGREYSWAKSTRWLSEADRQWIDELNRNVPLPRYFIRQW